ncbi:GAF domain-containing protein [Streptacidiphilus sp. P02-A3a]|nr:GAF domain-containing protein [Streptacidiphilus sp. P02-A3a]QMU74349.1 GAF domain-containing protein [Streptacidiphilus sp. P02-A3a]
MTAVSALLGQAERDHQELLRSVVDTARGLFGAAAASVFLLDAETDELVFEAVSGAGEGHLVGERFPASRGIAGWVLAAQEPLVVGDLATHPTFARDLAETTGYVPRSLMAAPLLRGEEPIGVMEVLDPVPSTVSPLGAAELLSLFAGQAAIALGVLRRSRTAHRLLVQEDGEPTGLAEVARLLDSLGADRRAAGLNLLGSVHRLLSLAG